MNIGLVLRSCNSKDDELFFNFEDSKIAITSVRNADNSQHDFTMTKEEYIFLRGSLTSILRYKTLVSYKCVVKEVENEQKRNNYKTL